MFRASLEHSWSCSALWPDTCLLVGGRVHAIQRRSRKYVRGSLEGQQAASEQVRDEFKALVEQCRAALRKRADEKD
jgi:hypothetical protein